MISLPRQTGCGYLMIRTVRPGFTLLEVLVVVTLIGLLAAILLPSLSRVRQQTRRAVCMGNLQQIGTAILSYRQQYREVFPVARAIPGPWVDAGVDDPPLPAALRNELAPDSGVYACPGDNGYVYPLSGISYIYNTTLSGRRPRDSWYHQGPLRLTETDIPVAYDFDGVTGDELPEGTAPVPFFHLRRNLLFADGRVGDFKPPPETPDS